MCHFALVFLFGGKVGAKAGASGGGLDVHVPRPIDSYTRFQQVTRI